jgi:hypothetical protein
MEAMWACFSYNLIRWFSIKRKALISAQIV